MYMVHILLMFLHVIMYREVRFTATNFYITIKYMARGVS